LSVTLLTPTVTTLLAGILVAFVATTLAAAWRRAPTRTSCPQCGGRTESVRAPLWMRKAAPDRSLRWCPSCSWEGMGRVGPEWVPGHPAAHGSGFFWGDERLPVDFGFKFAFPPAAEDDQAPAEPPAHPSGFRFAGEPPHLPPKQFRWAQPRTPPAFQWRTRREAPPVHAGFRWRA